MLMGLDLYLVQQQAVEKFQRVVKIIFYSMTPCGGCSCSALYWFVASSTLQLGVDAHAIDVPYVEKVIQAAEFHDSVGDFDSAGSTDSDADDSDIPDDA